MTETNDAQEGLAAPCYAKTLSVPGYGDVHAWIEGQRPWRYLMFQIGVEHRMAIVEGAWPMVLGVLGKRLGHAHAAELMKEFNDD